jgi:uncharacterized protein YigE (DUF2233 family)
LPLEQLQPINHEGKTYRFAWFAVDDPSRLSIYPNYPEVKESGELQLNYQCDYLTSGGFYLPDHSPLGWLVSEGQELSPAINSRLLDGFLIVNGQTTINFDPPTDPPLFGVQSGPMLIYDSQTLNLKIANDELRRRIVAGLNQDDELIFMVITGKDSTHSGPLLADLSQLLLIISKQTRLNFKRAINLDGGTASAFVTPQLTLEELNPVGNIFCYNQN